MYAQKNLGSRHCFRCDLPLTDAASLNEGIGPICRKLDNAILARLIPSDMDAVLSAYTKVNPLELAEGTLDTFMALEAAFRDPTAGGRDDWRKEVKRIEWMLSHGQTYGNIEALKAIVLALGYVGLVALWSGEAATGLASIFGQDGRLFVQGPQNKSARWALKKISGCTFHPSFSGVVAKACWSVPAAGVREFRLAIITHYPNFVGLHEACEVAKEYNVEQEALAAAAKVIADQQEAAYEAEKAAYLAANPPPVAPVVAAAPPVVKKGMVSIVEVGDQLRVSTPFRVSYISELRATSKDVLPRKWEATEKAWIFPVTHKAQVLALVDKHYGH